MNKKIKMIELIDMYVEDVVQPKKVKFDGNVYIYNGNSVLQQIINEYKGKIVFLLNEKVEILEEDKDIELLNLDTDKLKGKEVIRAIDYLLEGRINELVKEVNKLRKDNNNG